jgi:hypothetical protein
MAPCDWERGQADAEPDGIDRRERGEEEGTLFEPGGVSCERRACAVQARVPEGVVGCAHGWPGSRVPFWGEAS